MIPVEVPQAGDWFTAGGGIATLLEAEGEERLLPLWIPEDMRLDAIGAEVAAAGATGAVGRLGIRGTNPITRRPEGLLLDAGTVDATVATTVSITGLNVPVPEGLIYLSLTTQGGASTRPNWRGVTSIPWQLVKGDFANTASVSWATAGGAVPGALPATFGGTRQNFTAPRIWVRRV